jgi:hypothetical protein
LDADRIGVAHDEDGPLGAVALDAGDKIGSLGIERKDLAWDAIAIDDRLQDLARSLSTLMPLCETNKMWCDVAYALLRPAFTIM